MMIGFVADGYQPRVSGVAVAIKLWTRELRRLGHEVLIFAPDCPGLEAHEENVVRIRAHDLYVARPWRVANPWDAYRRFKTLFPRLDLVHVHFPALMEPAARRAARRLGLPYVITYHSYLERNLPHYVPLPLGPWGRALAAAASRYVCNRADLVIAPATDTERLLRSYGVRAPIAVVPSGIDLERFYDADGQRARHALGLDGKVLVYVGRLATEKNLAFLLEALKRLLAHEPDLKLLLVGTGKDEGRIRRDVKRLDLEGHVIFAGYVSDRQQLADLYAAGDVFVFASLTETQGLVIAEALAAGTPVVAVAAPGIRDALQDGQGGFLTPLDLEPFVERVLRLLRDGRLHAEQAARARRAAAPWSAQALTERLLAHYQRLWRAGLDRGLRD